MPRKRKTDIEYTANGNGEVTAEKLGRDTFPTEFRIVRAAIKALELPFDREDEIIILDAGAGDTGVWGLCAKERFPNCVLIGSEVRDVPMPLGYDQWITGDFRKIKNCRADLIIGNIPFSLARSFITHALTMLESGGSANFLLRAQFNGGQDRYAHFWKHAPLMHEYYCVSRMPFIKKRNNKTGLMEPASDVWDYAIFSFCNEWNETWWKTSRWDYKTDGDNQGQLSLFDNLSQKADFSVLDALAATPSLMPQNA